MLVYDLEIEKAILAKGEKKIEGIEYCKGWGDHKGMGMSVLVVYDYVERQYRIFMRDNIEEFARLVASREYIIGFNHERFDNKVIEAVFGITIPKEKNFDIMRAVWAAVSDAKGVSEHKMHKGYGLDPLSIANLGLKKNGNGAHAPIWWQRGKIGLTTDYCLQDVNLTRRLLDLIMNAPSIIDPVNKEQRLRVKVPIRLKQTWALLNNPNHEDAIETYKKFLKDKNAA